MGRRKIEVELEFGVKGGARAKQHLAYGLTYSNDRQQTQS